MALSFILFVSCLESNEYDGFDQKEEDLFSQNSSLERRKFNLFFATWEEWGRSSKSCKGWGLCEFKGCAFCCTNESDEIVSCKDNNKIEHSGTIKIYEDTNQGYMTIKLDPTFEDQAEAINTNKTLYIDDIIQFENIKLRAGAYEYRSDIGPYGGYLINAYID